MIETEPATFYLQPNEEEGITVVARDFHAFVAHVTAHDAKVDEQIKALQDTHLVELTMSKLVEKLEPYVARIASALEVQNQLRTQELWDVHKQIEENAHKETDMRIVENDPAEAVSEGVRNEYSVTVGKSLDERIHEYTTKHPETSVRKTAKALGCSPASVQRWKDKQKCV